MAQTWTATAKKRPKLSDMVWIRFRAIDSISGKRHQTATKVKAESYVWKDRGLPFDCMEWTTDDEG